ncbi:DUF4272 domain-containing protein [Herbaspirillum seropedicae]|uniref:DUF4272 domain-containing protein n=1 Tax=Herbaspirillum seropedicae TaxID=964 RepID=UPI000863C04F|nr:DUF4272 domain-containing protein [Herbaspirillum seropedicae]AON55640.1 hypothetical protein Hsc_3372 [Herbaspirillum seropedicae]
MSAASHAGLKRRIVLGAALFGMLPLAIAAPSVEERRKKIKSMDQKNSHEALQRRARSESVLRAEGVPINQYLPVIETEDEAKRRSTSQISQRALCVLLVALKGEGLEQPIVERIAQDFRLLDDLTPKERAFMAAKTPSQHDRVQFSWKYEAAWVLLWAMGYVSKLDKPTKICDVQFAVKTMRDRGPDGFEVGAKLRSLRDILDQADLIYRYHWAVVDARIKGRPAPANLDPGVVLERHYGLNWLIGYMEQAWDDISTDT